MESDRSLVEFTQKTLVGEKPWKGHLGAPCAVFVVGGQELIFAKKEAVTVTKKVKKRPNNTVKARFDIGTRSFSGKIPPETYARFERWKSMTP